MTTPPRSTRAVGLVLAAVLALVVAACSSDGGDAAAPSTTAASGGDRSTTTAAPSTGGASGTLERYADYVTVSYDDPSHWVCRPDAPDDICHSDLDATRIDADGTLTVEPFEPADDPAIDCFYVYPTISRDETPNSDWEASPNEEGYVTLNQAARLRSQCRVFAPVYRQITLTSLVGRLSGATDAEPAVDPFDDVLDAFRTYMAEDNGGRGFVLIGHSQGGGMLNQLIKTEVDPNDDVRAKLVGAYLVGSAIAVPEGKVVGGDFADVPLCTESGEVGCAMTWATFRSTAPPPEGSLFGYPRGGEGVAGCVSPAAPAGGSADLDAYFPKEGGASILTPEVPAADGRRWVDASAGEIETPFVHLPDLVSGECTTQGNLNFLEATVHGDPADPRADDVPGDLTPDWGLHLIDVNLAMGDVVEQVRQQAEAYAG